MLESSIQRSVVTYARDQGAIAIKLSTLGMAGTAGWPDYLFLFDMKAEFMEFKRPGGKLTLLQKQRYDQLTGQGFQPYVCDNAVLGKDYLNRRFGWGKGL